MTNVANDRPANGLFSDLSHRFTPGVKPEIRPRLQAMFEGSEAAPELQEVNEETVAERPEQNSESRAATAVRSSPAPPVPDRQVTPSQATHKMKTQLPDDGVLEPAEQVESPASIETDPPAIVTENRADQNIATLYPTRDPVTPPLPTVDQGEAPAPTQVEIPHNVPEATTPVAGLQPMATHQPGPEGLDQHMGEADISTVEPSAPPTVRIGRIELRQPPAPVKPQPKLATAQAAPPRLLHTAGSTRTQGSRLTDYLGWKKK